MGCCLPLIPLTFHSCTLKVRAPVVFSPWKPSQACRLSRKRSFVRVLEGKFEDSWIRLDENSGDDGCGGWSARRLDVPNGAGFQRFILSGIGTSIAAISLAAMMYCLCSRKGFRLNPKASFYIFHDFLAPSGSSKEIAKITEQSATPTVDVVVPDEIAKDKFAAFIHESKLPAYDVSAAGEDKRIIISVPADSAQLEALCVLKKLKIIDDDANADDLCTKREYARWLVKANSMLERKAIHRIDPAILIAGSVSPAFDDVNVEDPDFWCIQALGEAGVVFSRLSSSNSFTSSDLEKSNEGEGFYFFPDSLIPRLDLVNWRAMLEYSFFSEWKEKISPINPRLLDLSVGDLNASPYLLMDFLSGDGSIITRTFGNIRRLQPDKPVTKGQAAVALTSGRMTELIRSELSRLETEEISRAAEIEEIKRDLLNSGDIQKYWNKKLSEAKKIALSADGNLERALLDLEIERAAEEERFANHINEKSILECWKQMFLRLKDEVDELNQKYDNESVALMAEKQNLESVAKSLHEERDAVFESISVLETEKGVIQALRYWVDEEAWNIRERANFLQQASRRWKANGDIFSS